MKPILLVAAVSVIAAAGAGLFELDEWSRWSAGAAMVCFFVVWVAALLKRPREAAFGDDELLDDTRQTCQPVSEIERELKRKDRGGVWRP